MFLFQQTPIDKNAHEHRNVADHRTLHIVELAFGLAQSCAQLFCLVLLSLSSVQHLQPKLCAK